MKLLNHYLLRLAGTPPLGGVEACNSEDQWIDGDAAGWQNFDRERCQECEGYVNLQALKREDPQPRHHEWVPIHKAYQCKFCPAIYPSGTHCRGRRK